MRRARRHYSGTFNLRIPPELHEQLAIVALGRGKSINALAQEALQQNSGKVLLRIDPALHAKAAMQAEAEGKSLNAWAQEKLQKAIANG